MATTDHQREIDRRYREKHRAEIRARDTVRRHRPEIKEGITLYQMMRREMKKSDIQDELRLAAMAAGGESGTKFLDKQRIARTKENVLRNSKIAQARRKSDPIYKAERNKCAAAWMAKNYWKKKRAHLTANIILNQYAIQQAHKNLLSK